MGVEVLIVFMAGVGAGQSAPLRPEIRGSVDVLEAAPYVVGPGGGKYGVGREIFSHVEALALDAATHELVELTSHRQPLVRTYAFWALTWRRDVDLLDVLFMHVHDDAALRASFGCTSLETTVGDFMIRLAVGDHLVPNEHPLDDRQRERLWRALVTTPSRLLSRRTALLRVGHHPDLLPHVRGLVDDPDLGPMAALVLIRGRHPEGRRLLDTAREQWSDAAMEEAFHLTYGAPDPDLRLVIEAALARKVLSPDVRYAGWRALASYRDARAVDWFRAEAARLPASSIEVRKLIVALEGRTDAVFDPLFFDVWHRSSWVTQPVFDTLLVRQRERALDQAEVTLRAGTPGVVPFLLESLHQARPEKLGAIVQEQLTTASSVSFYAYCWHVIRTGDRRYVAPLLARLEATTDRATAEDAIEALLSFDDPEIEREVVAALKHNDFLPVAMLKTRPWGEWRWRP